jgi:hypothetical protein
MLEGAKPKLRWKVELTTRQVGKFVDALAAMGELVDGYGVETRKGTGIRNDAGSYLRPVDHDAAIRRKGDVDNEIALMHTLSDFIANSAS